jgi:small subunit ribosomal protein S6e
MQDIKEGNRLRKLVRGNMITEEIYQLNCLLVEGSFAEKPPSEESKLAARPADNNTTKNTE